MNEWIVSIIMSAVAVILAFVGYTLYVLSKVKHEAAGAILDAEQPDSDGKEKFNACVGSLMNLIPLICKLVITRTAVERIVQAVFDKVEAYAKKQIEKKGKPALPENPENATNGLT
ncbi:MAG: hypothetical protein FWD58_02665 [Firmicutes bacterium]|nr:hypothetical protein [Bacillota bacterium]